MEKNREWSNQFNELKNKSYSAAICKNCPMLETRILEVTGRNQELSVTLKELEKGKAISGNEGSSSEEIGILKNRISELIAKNLEYEKKIYELRFVKEKASNEYNEKEDRERKARERQVLITKNKHLEERVRILESYGSGEEHWYSGQPAQRMYLKQARTTNSKALNFQQVKDNRPNYPSRSKYAGLSEHKVCWSCGMSGHFKYDCKKRWAQRTYGHYPEHQSRSNRKVPRYPKTWVSASGLSWANQEYYDVQDNGHEYYPEPEYYHVHYPQPGKAKLAWVRKH